jgi:hypothetical protein
MALLIAFALMAGSPATLYGVGDLRIGMPVSELQRIGGTLNHEGDDGSDCSYWDVPDRKGLALMVSGGRVVRIDVDSAEYRTASGAHVGMSEEQVRRIYGKALAVEPHPYTAPEGHYLVYKTHAEPLGLIFETYKKRVESFRVGLWAHVQLIEGCS